MLPKADERKKPVTPGSLGMKRFLFAISVLALVSLPSCGGAKDKAPQPTSSNSNSTSENDDSSLKVLSAKRTQRYDSDRQGFVPNDPERDVVLVIEVSGNFGDVLQTSMKLSDLAKNGKLYVLAGDRHCEISRHTVTDKPRITLVAIVPRNQLNLQLLFDDHPAITFKAEEIIHKTLSSD